MPRAIHRRKYRSFIPIIGNDNSGHPAWDYTYDRTHQLDVIVGPSRTKKTEFNPVEHYRHTISHNPFSDVGIPGEVWSGKTRTNVAFYSPWFSTPLIWGQKLKGFSRKEFIEATDALSGDNLLNSLRELTEVPALKNIPKRLDSAYLYYKFGLESLWNEFHAWKKSIDNFESIYQALLESSGNDRKVHVRRKGKYRKYFTHQTQNLTIVTRLSGDVIHRGQCVANYKLDKNNPYTRIRVLLDRSGLFRIPSTILQAQKLSFVLDWFFRVSEIVSLLDPEPMAGELFIDRFAGSMKVHADISSKVTIDKHTTDGRWINKQLSQGSCTYYLRDHSLGPSIDFESLIRNPFRLEKKSDPGKLSSLAALSSQKLIR